MESELHKLWYEDYAKRRGPSLGIFGFVCFGRREVESFAVVESFTVEARGWVDPVYETTVGVERRERILI